MHYVDFSAKKKQAYKRIGVYAFFGLIVAVITVILVYAAQGYDINRKTGQVIKNGLVLVDSLPDDATILLNGNEETSKTPARLSIPENNYDIVLAKEGYRTWTRTIQVVGSRVYWVNYPILIPVDIKTQSLARFTNLETAEAYKDSKFAVTIQANESAITKINFSGDKIESESLDFNTSNLTKKAGKTGSFSFVAWAKDDAILLRHKIGNVIEFIVYSLNDNSVVNINNTFKIKPSKVDFNDDNANELIALVGKKVHQINIADNDLSEAVKSNAVNFVTDLDQTYVLVEQGDDLVLERLTSDDDHYTLSNGSYSMMLSRFEGHTYLTLGNNKNTVLVFKDPISIPADKDQLSVFKTIELDGENKVSSSLDGRFISVQSGTEFKVLSIEDKRIYRYELPQFSSGTFASWLDNYHLSIGTEKGLMMFDFEGSNRYVLTDSDPSFKAILSRDREFNYSFNTKKNTSILNVSRLLTD